MSQVYTTWLLYEMVVLSGVAWFPKYTEHVTTETRGHIFRPRITHLTFRTLHTTVRKDRNTKRKNRIHLYIGSKYLLNTRIIVQQFLLP